MNLKFFINLSLSLVTLASVVAFSQTPATVKDKNDTDQRGLLPELNINSTDENENQKKSLQSEILITKSENEAIAALINVLKIKKGKPEEPEVWFRLAELYMRRSKSGRFFDIFRNTTIANDVTQPSFSAAPPEIKDETAKTNLQRASQIYIKIQKEFHQFKMMDAVLFNNAFALHQLNKKDEALDQYERLVTIYKVSEFLPDSYLAMGEIRYEKKDFAGSVKDFKSLEKFPESRVYPYGMYKSAWALYNLHQSDLAIEKLTEVAKFFSPSKKSHSLQHNLRSEALRDLALFYGETKTAEDAYEFFSKICNKTELTASLLQLGKLYFSHSRHKELSVLFTELFAKIKSDENIGKANLLLFESFEVQKNYDKALKHLRAAFKICKGKSCHEDVVRTTSDTSKKWWDQWQKNKNNTALSDRIYKVLKFRIENEDLKTFDINAHYALADLYFQKAEFKQAAVEYKLVYEKTQPSELKHDSLYAYIVSLEKISKTNPEKTYLQTKCLLYKEKYPKGAQIQDITFLIAFINYEFEKYDLAKKQLIELYEQSAEIKTDLRLKIQDLLLDNLNALKDYELLQVYTKKFTTPDAPNERKLQLDKIFQEAEYAELQKNLNVNQALQSIKKLETYANSAKQQSLAEKSLLQAISIGFTKNRPIEASELAESFYDKYPNNSESLKALKEAATQYTRLGFLQDAARVYNKLAQEDKINKTQHLNAAVQIYKLYQQNDQVKSIINTQLSESKNAKTQSELLWELRELAEKKTDATEVKKIEQQILYLNQEPFVSNIRYGQLEKLYSEKRWTDAFSLAKSLVSKATPQVKAKARVLQAKILEKEFIDTKTRTSVEKLSFVLAIKTEKLEKAQSAYLSAAKLATDDKVKQEILEGLHRIYSHYIDSVLQLKVKTDLSEQDAALLKTELSKLAAPIIEKKIDAENKLLKIQQLTKIASSHEIDFENHPVDQTVPVYFNDHTNYFNSNTTVSINENNKWTEEKLKQNCDITNYSTKSSVDLSKTLHICFESANQNELEKMATHFTRNNPDSSLGLYYQALLASKTSNYELSDFLTDLALRLEPKNSFLLNQKAKVSYNLKDIKKSYDYAYKAFEAGSQEKVAIIAAIRFNYQAQQYKAAKDLLAKLDWAAFNDKNLNLIYSQTLIELNEVQQAKSLIEKWISVNSQFEYLLQLAKTQQILKVKNTELQKYYQTASQVVTDTTAKDWTLRKIDYLTRSTESAQNQNREPAASKGFPNETN